MEPNVGNINRLIAAMESGKYRQVRGPYDSCMPLWPGYCAVAMPTRLELGYRKYWFSRTGSGDLHSMCDKILGLPYVCLKLFEWNEGRNLTFPQIAEKLRAHCADLGINLNDTEAA